MYSLISFIVLLAIILVGIGINCMGTINDGLKTVYYDRVVPLKELKVIVDL